MKKGFTLLEMLIVMALLVTLMGIVYKLHGIAGDSEDKSCTILRMQRLENCLAGYHAAFGNYPPVQLHGSRDISTYVPDGDFMQDKDHEPREIDWGGEGESWGSGKEEIAWAQVEAACRAQPISCEYPFPDNSASIQELDRQAAEMTEYAMQDEIWPQLSTTDKTIIWGDKPWKTKQKGNWDSINKNPGRLAPKMNSSDWNEIQLFRFGLMSYLLPRYLVMMVGKAEFYTSYEQWNANNRVPCDPLTGEENFGGGGWEAVKKLAPKDQEATLDNDDTRLLASIPSQAVCARWMPNLEKICKCNSHPVVFGVKLRSTRKRHGDYLGGYHYSMVHIRPYRPHGQKVGSQQYVLDFITVRDGWGRDFYYYSPEPYQRYVLWSAGPNGKTFPPWIERDSLGSAGARRVGEWTHDDIMHLSK